MVICTRKFIIGDCFCVKVTKAKSWAEKGDDKDIFFLPRPSVSYPPSLSFFCSTLFFFQSPVPSKAPCKRPQHCWMLHHVVFVCTPCCMSLRVVAQNLKPVKLLATCKRTQQLPEMLRPFARSLTEILEQAQPRRLRWRQQDIRDIIIRMSELPFECRGTLNV